MRSTSSRPTSPPRSTTSSCSWRPATLAEPDLLGLYEGIALTERDTTYAGALPDTVTIYRDALLDICETEDDVVDEVAVTVIHEIAHHFGIDDERLHELGWA